jgi:hypothetical protein
MIGYNYSSNDLLTVITLLRPNYGDKYRGMLMNHSFIPPFMKKQVSLSSVCDFVLGKLQKNYDYNSKYMSKVRAVRDIRNLFSDYVNKYIDICYPGDDIIDPNSMTWIDNISNLFNDVYKIQEKHTRSRSRKYSSFWWMELLCIH